MLEVIQRGRTAVRPALFPPLSVVPAVSDTELSEPEYVPLPFLEPPHPHQPSNCALHLQTKVPDSFIDRCPHPKNTREGRKERERERERENRSKWPHTHPKEGRDQSVLCLIMTCLQSSVGGERPDEEGRNEGRKEERIKKRRKWRGEGWTEFSEKLRRSRNEEREMKREKCIR